MQVPGSKANSARKKPAKRATFKPVQPNYATSTALSPIPVSIEERDDEERKRTPVRWSDEEE